MGGGGGRGGGGGAAPRGGAAAAIRIRDLIDPQRVLRECARLAYSDIGDLFTPPGELKTGQHWPEHAGRGPVSVGGWRPAPRAPSFRGGASSRGCSTGRSTRGGRSRASRC